MTQTSPASKPKRKSPPSQKSIQPALSPQDHYLINNILNNILFFFACAFIGWIWEGILTLFQTGEIVNRGVLHGPWLPIYGFGGLIIALLLRRFKKHPGLVFLSAAVLCGLLEYSTGWYLETFKHLKWWDYSDMFINVNGYICLLSVTAFGVCGLLITYFLYPNLIRLFNHFDLRARKVLCLALVLFFLADFVYSSDVPNTGYGITNDVPSGSFPQTSPES